jgi:hypothetical protein
MPTTYKVLGQQIPTATTVTTLYTVPSATNTVVSTISVANLNAAPTTYRIAVSPAGATLENKHYIVYDSSISPQDTVILTIGLTLEATDVIRVQSSSGNVSFNSFGSEIA